MGLQIRYDKINLILKGHASKFTNKFPPDHVKSAIRQGLTESVI